MRRRVNISISPLYVVKYNYNSVGAIVSKSDEDGYETLYDYNVVGKLSKISYADGKTVEMAFNPLKQLTEMKDWLSTTKIALDDFDKTEKLA